MVLSCVFNLQARIYSIPSSIITSQILCNDFPWTRRLLASLKITFRCWWQLRREKSAKTAGRTSEWAETAKLEDNYRLNYCYPTHTVNPFTQRQHSLIYILFCLGLLNIWVHLNNTHTSTSLTKTLSMDSAQGQQYSRTESDFITRSFFWKENQ